ncbi:Periplasmic zinc-binding protein TroA precursor [Planctomycetes bacterium Pan216]|uniref:Periplasmic zinc-binding protein TroA n=1 Tax=Kolteria novifilia TaxID=2527975 RepID=A0A518BC84_9BACT|nr:Periplasmic zinc-binding protein TroA precursor [Planctomycetes bacterium Pan216]
MPHVVRWVLGAALMGALWGCGAADHAGPSAGGSTFSGSFPIKIACTTGMVADVVREVGGDHVEVEQLMGEGVDPHLYKTSPGDIRKLSAADMIFYSGLHLEGKMADVFVQMARRKPTYAVSEEIPHETILETEEESFDPHIWFDVELWSKTAGVVAKALSDFDPSHAEDYAVNAKRYEEQLAQLHTDVKSLLESVPESQRYLVTAHDAFAYFGRAYDINVMAIQGISTESEAGVKRINELVDFLTKNKIKAVFIESSVSDRNIQALIEGCKARGHDVVIGGELFSDAMGTPGTPEGTYEGMVRHNANTIAKALK